MIEICTCEFSSVKKYSVPFQLLSSAGRLLSSAFKTDRGCPQKEDGPLLHWHARGRGSAMKAMMMVESGMDRHIATSPPSNGIATEHLHQRHHPDANGATEAHHGGTLLVNEDDVETRRPAGPSRRLDPRGPNPAPSPTTTAIPSSPPCSSASWPWRTRHPCSRDDTQSGSSGSSSAKTRCWR